MGALARDPRYNAVDLGAKCKRKFLADVDTHAPIGLYMWISSNMLCAIYVKKWYDVYLGGVG